MFYGCRIDLIFFRRLISEVVWPFVTKLCRMVDNDPDLWNSVKHLGGPFPRNLAAQKHQISGRFRTISRLDREYLRNATRHRQSKNGIANCRPSRTGKLNSVHFGPQMAKNRTAVLTHPPAIVQRNGGNKSVAFARGQHAYPTGGHRAGHWDASSSFLCSWHTNEKIVQESCTNWLAQETCGSVVSCSSFFSCRPTCFLQSIQINWFGNLYVTSTAGCLFTL